MTGSPFHHGSAGGCPPSTFLVSLSRGIIMWLGWTCWASFTSVISVSAFCSVGALATVSFLSLLTSLVTARARGSLSHLPCTPHHEAQSLKAA